MVQAGDICPDVLSETEFQSHELRAGQNDVSKGKCESQVL